MTNHETTAELHQSFRRAMFNSPRSKSLLAAEGIDRYSEKVSVGLNGGKFHRRKDKVDQHMIETYVELGLLKDKDRLGRYLTIWGKNSLMFPVRNQQEEIVNWYAFPIKHNEEEQGFLLNQEGFYPKYPSKYTQTLELEFSVFELARKLTDSEEETQENKAKVALYEGKPTEQHYELIRTLPFLKKLGIPTDLLDEETRRAIQDFIGNERPDVELFEIKKNYKVEESKNDEIEAKVKTKNASEAISFDAVNDEFEFGNEDKSLDPLNVEVVGGVEGVVKGIVANDDPLHFQRLELTLKIYHLQMPKRIYRNSVDIYHFQGVNEIVEEASAYLGVETEELQLKLDDLINEIESAIQRNQTASNDLVTDAFGSDYTPNILSAKEESEVMELLKNPKLVQTIHEELLANIGIVNEKNNRMIAFLTTVSRKLKNPLHLINFGSTGTGKSHLIETVGRTLPPEELLELTTISEKALFNINGSLAHKVIMIQDLFDVSDTVMYQIRELQSKGKLTRSVTQKQKNGTFTTIFQETRGPVSIIASTTNDEIYGDNSNRSILITQDETEAQDKAILARQKSIASQSINRSKENKTIQLLQNLQRKLKTYPIKNPYANDLELPPFVERKRRTMGIYLGMIETVTLLNQFQRKIEIIDGKEFLVTHVDDIRWANEFIEPVLTYKSDLLGNASRNFFEELKGWAKEQKIHVFGTKDIARGLRKSPNTTKKLVRDLKSFGLLQVVSGDRYRNGFSYSIAEESEYASIKKQVQETLTISLKRIETKYVA